MASGLDHAGAPKGRWAATTVPSFHTTVASPAPLSPTWGPELSQDASPTGAAGLQAPPAGRADASTTQLEPSPWSHAATARPAASTATSGPITYPVEVRRRGGGPAQAAPGGRTSPTSPLPASVSSRTTRTTLPSGSIASGDPPYALPSRV